MSSLRCATWQLVTISKHIEETFPLPLDFEFLYLILVSESYPIMYIVTFSPIVSFFFPLIAHPPSHSSSPMLSPIDSYINILSAFSCVAIHVPINVYGVQILVSAKVCVYTGQLIIWLYNSLRQKAKVLMGLGPLLPN